MNSYNNKKVSKIDRKNFIVKQNANLKVTDPGKLDDFSCEHEQLNK